MRKPRDLVIPSQALVTLRRALHEEAGPLTAIQVLQTTGYEVGLTLFDTFAREIGGDPQGLGGEVYFLRLARFLEARGWGTLRHSAPHPGVGLMSSGDWAEANADETESQPSCAFSAGLLSAMLTRTAGAPVAVLQVACRSRGDEECSFAFGSEAAVHELYGLLSDDRDLETALAEL